MFSTSSCRWMWLLLFTLAWKLQINASEIRVVCYYTNWSVYRPGTAKFSPQNINPYLCTHLIYAFGGFTKENALKPFDKYQDIEKGGYAKFTGLKTYNKNLKTMLAVGGWNEGSSRFSPMVANVERRKQFVKNSIKFLRQNHFDGLDLDWEYPNFRDGGKPRDKDNYAQLVQELREEFDRESEKTGRPRLLLTMAVPAGIEYINKGYDVPKLTKYLDWMNILSYDYHSAFEPAVNHHSPLYSLEEDSEYNYDADLNIDYTIKHYLEAGAEPNKLVLGIPTYGRSYTLFNPEANELGAPADGPGDMGDATRENGYLAYYEVCEYLKSDDWTVVQPNPKAMGPYAYKDNQWVGYDDEAIVRKKSEYVAENHLGGIMFWSIDNDDFRGNCHGKPYPLIESAKDALIAASGVTVDNLISPPEKPFKPRNTRTRTRTPVKTSTESQDVSRKVQNSGGRQSSETASTRRRIARPRNEVKEEQNEVTKRRVAAAKQNRANTIRRGSRRDSSVTTSTSKYTTPSYTTPSPPTTPDTGSDFKCEDEGFFAHPRDCRKYFWCLSSGPSNLGIVAHQFTCPSGLYFNKAADSCDYTQNVLCKKKTSKTTPATTSSTTTTSTTEASTKRTIHRSTTSRTTTTTEDPEYEEYEYEDVIDTPDDDTVDSEEDPKVIKELLDLIKKAGGIEELERQLQFQENGSASVTSTGSTTVSTISKTLYERVLNKASSKNTDSLNNSRKNGSTYTTINRNSRGPQNLGIPDTKDENAPATTRSKPQYITISRQRPTTIEPEITETDDKQLDKDALNDDEISENIRSQTSIRNSNQQDYVTIRRNRFSTTTETDFRASSGNEEEQESVKDNEGVTAAGLEYVTLRRGKPSTSEDPTSVSVTLRSRPTSPSFEIDERSTVGHTTLDSSSHPTTPPINHVVNLNAVTVSNSDRTSNNLQPSNINVLESNDFSTEVVFITDRSQVNNSATNNTNDIEFTTKNTPTLLDPRPFSINRSTRPPVLTTPQITTKEPAAFKESTKINRSKPRADTEEHEESNKFDAANNFKRPQKTFGRGGSSHRAISEPRPFQATTEADIVNTIIKRRVDGTIGTPGNSFEQKAYKPTRRRGQSRYKAPEISSQNDYDYYNGEMNHANSQVRTFRPDIAAGINDLSSLTSADIVFNRGRGRGSQRNYNGARPTFNTLVTTETSGKKDEEDTPKDTFQTPPLTRKANASEGFGKIGRRVTRPNLNVNRSNTTGSKNSGNTPRPIQRRVFNQRFNQNSRNATNSSESETASPRSNIPKRNFSRFTNRNRKIPSAIVETPKSNEENVVEQTENSTEKASTTPVRRIIKRIRTTTKAPNVITEETLQTDNPNESVATTTDSIDSGYGLNSSRDQIVSESTDILFDDDDSEDDDFNNLQDEDETIKLSETIISETDNVGAIHVNNIQENGNQRRKVIKRIRNKNVFDYDPTEKTNFPENFTSTTEPSTRRTRPTRVFGKQRQESEFEPTNTFGGRTRKIIHRLRTTTPKLVSLSSEERSTESSSINSSRPLFRKFTTTVKTPKQIPNKFGRRTALRKDGLNSETSDKPESNRKTYPSFVERRPLFRRPAKIGGNQPKADGEPEVEDEGNHKDVKDSTADNPLVRKPIKQTENVDVNEEQLNNFDKLDAGANTTILNDSAINETEFSTTESTYFITTEAKFDYTTVIYVENKLERSENLTNVVEMENTISTTMEIDDETLNQTLSSLDDDKYFDDSVNYKSIARPSIISSEDQNLTNFEESYTTEELEIYNTTLKYTSIIRNRNNIQSELIDNDTVINSTALLKDDEELNITDITEVPNADATLASVPDKINNITFTETAEDTTGMPLDIEREVTLHQNEINELRKTTTSNNFGISQQVNTTDDAVLATTTESVSTANAVKTTPTYRAIKRKPLGTRKLPLLSGKHSFSENNKTANVVNEKHNSTNSRPSSIFNPVQRRPFKITGKPATNKTVEKTNVEYNATSLNETVNGYTKPTEYATSRTQAALTTTPTTGEDLDTTSTYGEFLTTLYDSENLINTSDINLPDDQNKTFTSAPHFTDRDVLNLTTVYEEPTTVNYSSDRIDGSSETLLSGSVANSKVTNLSISSSGDNTTSRSRPLVAKNTHTTVKHASDYYDFTTASYLENNETSQKNESSFLNTEDLLSNSSESNATDVTDNEITTLKVDDEITTVEEIIHTETTTRVSTIGTTRKSIFRPAGLRPKLTPRSRPTEITQTTKKPVATSRFAPRSTTESRLLKRNRFGSRSSTTATSSVRTTTEKQRANFFTKTTERDDADTYDDEYEDADEDEENDDDDPEEKEEENQENRSTYSNSLFKVKKPIFTPKSRKPVGISTTPRSSSTFRKFGNSNRGSTTELNESDGNTQAKALRNKALFSKPRKMNTPYPGTSSDKEAAQTYTTAIDNQITTAWPEIAATTIETSTDATEAAITLHHVFADVEATEETSSDPTESSTTSGGRYSGRKLDGDTVERLIEVNRIVEVSLKDGKVKDSFGKDKNNVQLVPTVDRIGAINRVTVIKVIDNTNNSISTNGSEKKVTLKDQLLSLINANTATTPSFYNKSYQTEKGKVNIRFNGPNIVTELVNQPVYNSSQNTFPVYSRPVYSVQEQSNGAPIIQIDGVSVVDSSTPKPSYSTEASTISLEGLFHPTSKINAISKRPDTEDSPIVKIRLLEQDYEHDLNRKQKRIRNSEFIPVRLLHQDEEVTMKARVVEIPANRKSEFIKIAPISVIVGNTGFKEQPKPRKSAVFVVTPEKS